MTNETPRDAVDAGPVARALMAWARYELGAYPAARLREALRSEGLYVPDVQDAPSPQDAQWDALAVAYNNCAHDGNTSVDYRLCSTIERRHCDDCGATL